MIKKLFEFVTNLIPSGNGKLPFSRKAIGHQLVVHAFGEWKGEAYLNCKEAFEENYAKGLRLFEVDFSLSSDKKIVLFHDGHEERFGLSKNFNEASFLAASPYGATLLNLTSFIELLVKYPDVTIITDVKDDNVLVLSKIVEVFKQHSLDHTNRLIPQIYHPSEFPGIKKLNFSKIIFTVYRFRKKKNLTARFLRKTPEISALTVPDKWIESKDYLQLAQSCQIDLFVHTINDHKRRDSLFSKGVKGIYSDRLL